MALKSKQREYKPDLTVEEAFLLTPNRPDPRRRKQRCVGKSTKKGLLQFMFEMFELNEKLPRNQKKTNAALVDLLVKEFPSNYDLHVRLRKGERTSINYYRQKYNTGTLVHGRPIIYVSFRYDEAGNRVDYFTGKRPLTQAMQQRYLNRYRNKILANHTRYWTEHHEAKKAEAESQGKPYKTKKKYAHERQGKIEITND